MKKIGLILGMILYSTSAFANISIYPYSLDYAASSKKRVQTVRVINTSGKPQTYRVSVVNFTQDVNGGLHEVDDKTKGNWAKPYLAFSPRQFTLKDMEAQTINIARKSMSNAQDGEYVSHLKISEVKIGAPATNKSKDEETAGVSVQLTPLFAVTIPVTIVKGDNLKRATEVGDTKLEGDKLSVELKRMGNISSRVNIVVLNDKNKEIGRINNAKVYATTDKVISNVPLKKESVTSNMTLKLEDAETKKEIYQKSLHF